MVGNKHTWFSTQHHNNMILNQNNNHLHCDNELELFIFCSQWAGIFKSLVSAHVNETKLQCLKGMDKKNTSHIIIWYNLFIHTLCAMELHLWAPTDGYKSDLFVSAVMCPMGFVSCQSKAGCHLIKCSWAHNPNLVKIISLLLIFLLFTKVRSLYMPRQQNAVVACAKLLLDQNIIFHARATSIFTRLIATIIDIVPWLLVPWYSSTETNRISE